jgi:hypothetical protein
MEFIMPDGDVVYKIGKASGRSSVDRMMQIIRDFYFKYKVTPRVKIWRDREVCADKVFEFETMLHKFFVKYRYMPIIPFTGCTELFDVPLEDIIQAYEAVIEGEKPDFVYTKTEDQLSF